MSTYIPNNIRAIRKNAGLKQLEVAKQIGLDSFDRLSRMERGLSYATIPQLAKLMTIYNVQPSDIYPELFSNHSLGYDPKS